MTLTQEIAKRIHAISFDKLPDEAIPLARNAMLDAVACAFAGAPEETVRILERMPGYGGAEGPCAVFGRSYRTNPLDAVLVNGTAMHALDFDDMSITLGGHPTAMITPVIFALGDLLEISGKDAILAYVIGHETETRIARGVHMYHYDKGWHPTATLGVFGAAASAAHLLGLTEAQTATALGIAASLASGIKANFGSDTKPLHVGHGNRNGLFAALLAKEGFTANDAALEHKQGFLNVYNGEGHYDIDKILDGWGEPFDLVSVGVGLKKHPCCGGTHPPIEAMLSLRADNDIDPAQVDQIDVLVHPLRLPHTNNPDPRTPLQGKFSQQYTVARALLDGRVRLGHFEEAAITEPAVRELVKKVKAGPHPDMGPDFQPLHAAEVVVTMKDGSKFSNYNAVDLGRGLSNPMSDAELWEKFEDCAQCSLAEDAIKPAFDSLQTLETAANIRAVTALMLHPKDSGKSAAAE
jgi:2-methylcitrate dehydratase PrpD